jgi:hypothetical protein
MCRFHICNSMLFQMNSLIAASRYVLFFGIYVIRFPVILHKFCQICMTEFDCVDFSCV